MPDLQQVSAFNYLVPASGTTHMVQLSQVFSATPVVADFRQLQLDGQAFIPSGVFIDNTAGTGVLTVLINEVGFSIVVQPGQRLQQMYPAPLSQSASITGQGQATVVFVDFPVIPFLSGIGAGSAVSIVDGGDVALGSTTDVAAAGDTVTATLISLEKRLLQKSGIGSIPFGATPVAAVATTANALATATLPAVVGKTNYVTSIQVTGLGPTAAGFGNAQLTGVLGGAINHYLNAPAAPAACSPIIVNYNPPLPASALNTAISLALGALGAGSASQSVSIQGFVL